MDVFYENYIKPFSMYYILLGVLIIFIPVINNIFESPYNYPLLGMIFIFISILLIYLTSKVYRTSLNDRSASILSIVYPYFHLIFTIIFISVLFIKFEDISSISAGLVMGFLFIYVLGAIRKVYYRFIDFKTKSRTIKIIFRFVLFVFITLFLVYLYMITFYVLFNSVYYSPDFDDLQISEITPQDYIIYSFLFVSLFGSCLISLILFIDIFLESPFSFKIKVTKEKRKNKEEELPEKKKTGKIKQKE